MVEKKSERTMTTNENYTNKETSTILNDQTIELNFVRNRLETFQNTVLRDVQRHVGGMIDEVMQELRQQQLQTNAFRNFAMPQFPCVNNLQTNTCTNRTKNIASRQREAAKAERYDESIKSDKLLKNLSGNADDKDDEMKKLSFEKYDKLPNKIFVMRESLLTSLLEVDHMKTIYHIFYIIFLVFLLNNVSYDYFRNGSITFGLARFRLGFENIHKVAGIWIAQHVFVFSIFFALRCWIQIRMKFFRHKTFIYLWSYSWLLIYILTQLVFAYVPTKICLHLNLPFVTASVLLLETVRLLMKMHSFVRTVTPRALAEHTKTEQSYSKEINFPTFDKYLYYLFAPTLLYRDEYPRTYKIRWKFALSRFFEVVAVAFLYNYIYEHQIKHHFENFCLQQLNAAAMTTKLFGMIMPSILIFLAGFYMILHAWLNFTAELLRFGDRMFYRDWWTASNYAAYYRNWNVVVHDWLYEYIYKDFYNHIFKGSKGLSSLAVFTISALFHEYILGYALQVIFPVMFFFFGIIGVFLIFVTRYTPKSLGNIFLWFSLIYGNSWIISLYSMEYFARINCPKPLNSWTDYLIPHVWNYFK